MNPIDFRAVDAPTYADVIDRCIAQEPSGLIGPVAILF
jgi:hypothetical protein